MTPHDAASVHRILAVNPGSTSTKLSLFENETCVKNHEVRYPHKSGLAGEAFDREVERYVQAIKEFLAEEGQVRLDAVVGRGGFLDRRQTPVEGGVYVVARCDEGRVCVSEDIVAGVRDRAELDHASNLGIPIAARLAQEWNCPAYMVDAVVADDFDPLARFSGYAPIERKSIAHVLSVRAMARKAAARLEQPFEQCTLVVAHLGGGITVAAVRGGKIIDNSLALLGEGPFTPQRSGALPQAQLIDLCYSGRFTCGELKRELTKRAGLFSYLDEDRIPEIERRITAGDTKADLVLEAMAYQIAKDVGAMYVAAGPDVQAVVFSGGMARSELVVAKIRRRIDHLAPVIVFAENVEMEAMALGTLRVLRGEEAPKTYRLS
jgi:butyrate kinase